MKIPYLDFGTANRFHWWKIQWVMRKSPCGGLVGIFRNKPGIRPGRWGFYVWGFEFGSRNPGDPIGVFLKRVGPWPW